MSYRIEFTKESRKKLQLLDKPVRQAALDLFERLARLEDPHSAGKALTGPFAGYWRYTIHGDWRAIAKIERKVLTITIVKVAARDKVYT